MPILTSDLKSRLLAQALAEGFSNAKITTPDAVPQVPAQLEAFLQAGYHGQMTWMETRKEWRAAPQALWPDGPICGDAGGKLWPAKQSFGQS